MKTPCSFVHRSHSLESKEALVFISGLGLDIRLQREVMIRRFALQKKANYLSLDITKKALENTPIITLETEAIQAIQNLFPEKNFLFAGACFGANMALRLANRFHNQTLGVAIMSPAIDYSNPSIAQTIMQKIERKKNACQKLDLKEQLQQILIFRQLIEKMLPYLGKQEQKYTGPIKILHPQKDNFIPLKNSENMCKALNRPNIDLQILPNETHTLRDKNSMRIPIAVLSEMLQNAREH